MTENAEVPREPRGRFNSNVAIYRPHVDSRIFVRDKADYFGQVLVRILEVGLELNELEPGLVPSGYDQLLDAIDGLDAHTLGSIGFRAGLDRVIEGVSDADRSKTAEGFSLLAEYLLNEKRRDAALVFGHSAVFLDSSSALCAWKLARLRRRAGETDAVDWYTQSITLGHQQEDWETVSRAWLGLAQAAFERKRFRASMRFSGFALRIARMHKLGPVAAEALSGLAVLSFELGEPDMGLVHAREAVDEYGDNWPRIAMLANDIASYAYNDTGQFERALPLFRAALHKVADPYEKLHVMASYARAAGGARKKGELKWAIKEIYRLAELVPEQQGVVDAFKDVARGALSVRWLGEARRALVMASAAAQYRKTADRSGILPIEDELEALKKSMPRQRRPRALSRLENEFSEEIIEKLESTKIDGLVKELLTGSRQRAETTLLAIDCDPTDASAVEDLVVAAGGSIDAKVTTLKGISIFASELPVSSVASIVESPIAKFVTVPEEYTLID